MSETPALYRSHLSIHSDGRLVNAPDLLPSNAGTDFSSLACFKLYLAKFDTAESITGKS